MAMLRSCARILKMPGTAPPYWRLAIQTNALRSPRARSGSMLRMRAIPLPPCLLQERQNIWAELISGSRVTHPRINDEPGISNTFRCLAEQRLRVVGVPLTRDDQRGGQDLAQAVLEIVPVFRLDGYHGICRVLWRRQQSQQERCEPEYRRVHVLHDPPIGEQGAKHDGVCLHPSALLRQVCATHLHTSGLIAQAVGTRMDYQPADLIGVVGGEVLVDGVPRRDAYHVDRPPEFLADHLRVIVRLVEPNEANQQFRLRFVLG